MEFIKYKLVMVMILSLCYGNVDAYISGIKIQTIKAELYKTVHIPLLEKRIQSKNDIFTLGLVTASSHTKKLYKRDEYYILSIEDRHSKGKLHAIVKVRHPHYISSLTEIVFLLSQDFIGKKYNKKLLEDNLNKIAKKVIKRKGFILDNSNEIDYSDVLLYESGTRVLYKSYDDYLRPLEYKIKKNTLTYQDAYDFVYKKEQYKKTQMRVNDEPKKVTPLYRLVVFLHIAQNIGLGSEITHLTQLRKGTAKVDYFEILSPDIPFKIDRDGKVVVALNLEAKTYDFKAQAVTKDGRSNIIEFTIIIDPVKQNKFIKR